jgi:predicted transposase YbfD/YdcC
VTIDAMGCQKAIAEKIVNQGGDYILALKGNQSSLHEAVKLHFEQPVASSMASIESAEHLDKGHGRVEVRVCEKIR